MECGSMVSSSLRWIAEFEEQPPPEQCGGIDYAAIYRYLADLSEGEVPADLDPVTAARVTRLLSDLGEMMKGEELDKETNYLQIYRGPNTRFRLSENSTKNSKLANSIVDLNCVPGMNPLNLNLDLFANRDIDVRCLAVEVKEVTPE